MASAFEKYPADSDINVEIDAALDRVNPNDTESVEKASEVIRALIKKYPWIKIYKKKFLRSYNKLGANE